jgi:hypothetical protein
VTGSVCESVIRTASETAFEKEMELVKQSASATGYERVSSSPCLCRLASEAVCGSVSALAIDSASESLTWLGSGTRFASWLRPASHFVFESVNASVSAKATETACWSGLVFAFYSAASA